MLPARLRPLTVAISYFTLLSLSSSPPYHYHIIPTLVHQRKVSPYSLACLSPRVGKRKCYKATLLLTFFNFYVYIIITSTIIIITACSVFSTLAASTMRAVASASILAAASSFFCCSESDCDSASVFSAFTSCDVACTE